MESEMNYFGI